ncbi:sigma-70 family RNA polymerase sigma factor [Variovorax sp. KBS0712]|uniref:RNA polymerase sigma factor n=1 Tax=Variovorax sp. KBS0712 TaxID=2578111 RepID=UPI00111A457E|nr:sigma-70 family RNA polymerase sigma factor [Variovorax sp. KBS0712]TSD58844.1 sigma-70 family RNA polymerase sigma factor [Variovorax sp. KBS0712]
MSHVCLLPRGDAAGAAPAPPDVQQLLVAHYAQLHRRLSLHLGCADAATESLHDAWLRLGEAAFTDTLQNPVAYIFRVACNAAMDRLRAERPWQYAGEAEDTLAQVADHAPGPELIAEARSDLKAVERAMQGLPHRHQDIFVALRVHELTRHEVAVRHGLSLRRVDSTLRQAMQRLPSGRRSGMHV